MKKRQPDPLSPMHPSMHGSQVWKRTPRNMSSLLMDWETKRDLTAVALSIFTDCVNGGKTFQDAILAIYISGMQHGIAANGEDMDEAQAS